MTAPPIGWLGAVPCPYCGRPTAIQAATGPNDRMHGYATSPLGLFGFEPLRPFIDPYHCLFHGPIPHAALPEQHRRMIGKRKIATLVFWVPILALLYAVQIFRDP